MELSPIQSKIVNTTAPKVLVASSAGSGKTRCLVGRLQYLLNHGYDPSRIIAITFTNAAAQEIRDRINPPNSLFIGTIHSLANQFLLSRGIETSEFIEREQFNYLFRLVKQNPDCIKPCDYLLLDEGQDSTREQFEFMFDMIQPKEWMIFADWRQSIFRWNGATPDYILELKSRSDVTTFSLNENYRCGSKILDFGQTIINLAGPEYRDYSIPKSGIPGKVIETAFNPVQICKAIKLYDDPWSDWFILARTNDEVDLMCNMLEAQGIPHDTFKRSEIDPSEFNERMAANTVKVLTIHAAKGLESRYVIVIDAKFYNLEERCISYVAATSAKELLVWTRMLAKRRNPQVQTWET